MCTHVCFLQGGNEFPMGKPRLLSKKFLKTREGFSPKEICICFPLVSSLNQSANSDVLPGARDAEPSIPWPWSPLCLSLQTLMPTLHKDQATWDLTCFVLKFCASWTSHLLIFLPEISLPQPFSSKHSPLKIQLRHHLWGTFSGGPLPSGSPQCSCFLSDNTEQAGDNGYVTGSVGSSVRLGKTWFKALTTCVT